MKGVDVAVHDHRGRKQRLQLLVLPLFVDRPLAVLAGDFQAGIADAVGSRDKQEVVHPHRRSARRVELVAEIVAPQERPLGRFDAQDRDTGGDDQLPLAVDGDRDGRAVAGRVLAHGPGQLAGVFVVGGDGIVLVAAGLDDDQVAFQQGRQRRAPVVKLRHRAGVGRAGVFELVGGPDPLAVRRRQANQFAHREEAIELAVVVRRRRARAGALLLLVQVVRGDVHRPLLLAVAGAQADDGILGAALAHRVQAVVHDAHGGKAGAEWHLPQDLRRRFLPIGVQAGLAADAVALGPEELRPP